MSSAEAPKTRGALQAHQILVAVCFGARAQFAQFFKLMFTVCLHVLRLGSMNVGSLFACTLLGFANFGEGELVCGLEVALIQVEGLKQC